MLNCLKITNGIRRIARNAPSLASSKLPTLQKAREEIEREENEIRRELWPDFAFIEALKRKETFYALKGIVESCAYQFNDLKSFSLSLLDSVTYFLSSLREGGYLPLDSKSYKRFIVNLAKDGEIAKNLVAIVRSLRPIWDQRMDKHYLESVGSDTLFTIINSAFLELFLEEKQTLDLSDFDLPWQVSENFGLGLNRGEIKIKKAGQYAGAWLHGGEIQVEVAKDFAGFEMEGGKIVAKKVGDFAGAGMKAGCLVAEKSGQMPGVEAKGGTIYVYESGNRAGERAEGGTFVVEQGFGIASSIASNKPYFITGEMSTFSSSYRDYPEQAICYDEDSEYPEKSEYLDRLQRSPVLITSSKQLEVFRNASNGVVAIPNFEGSPVNENTPELCKGMNGGAMVFKTAPEANIGEGMEGGILIIEDRNISIEELRSRISPGKKGGLILLRVPDPERSTRTRLVDVEQ